MGDWIVGNQPNAGRTIRSILGHVLGCLCLVSTFACSSPKYLTTRRGDASSSEGKTERAGHHIGPNKLKRSTVVITTWQEKQFPPVATSVPKIEGAEMVNDDSLCMTCHEQYVKYHHTSVHTKQSCETCHGPGSQHIRTRGKEPNTLLSFKQMKPGEKAGVCMTCHEKDACAPGQKWRTSAHAHAGISCTDCHRSHYNVPAGTPSTTVAENGTPPLQLAAALQPKKEELDMQAIREASRSLGAKNPETCFRCHQTHADMLKPGHAHQIGGPGGFSCTSCHDAHSNVTQANRSQQCLQCHKNHPQWLTSKHAEHGVACADCHNPHATKMDIKSGDPKTCYRCHQQKTELGDVAHPHQICGAMDMKCATCHDPHGNVREETRTDLCLKCHKGHPTMAWKSSIHSQYGVACVDCHNPHPSTEVSDFVDIQHTHVRRPSRMPMSVEEPFVCYQCHAKTAAQFELPSHHPVREGKMVCSACHDSHGAQEKNLREPTVNLVCYRCHNEKSGPFVWEHPPVSENCDICHNPHGSVVNNLLHQPATFLCLRCHAGHRGQRRNIDRVNLYRPAFYTDCSQCHSQVHGSDLPSATREGPRLTR